MLWLTLISLVALAVLLAHYTDVSEGAMVVGLALAFGAVFTALVLGRFPVVFGEGAIRIVHGGPWLQLSIAAGLLAMGVSLCIAGLFDRSMDPEVTTFERLLAGGVALVAAGLLGVAWVQEMAPPWSRFFR